MSTPVPDMQPDTDEVLQAEAPDSYQAIPVCVSEVKTPVRVQQLPRKGASTFTRSVGTTTPAHVLRANPRRGRAVLVGDVAFQVAFSETACQADSAMALWPAATPLELTASVDVWVKAPTGTVALSVITEQWAEGE